MSLILFFVLIAAAAPTHAYIDPNLGSMLLLASVAAAGFAAEMLSGGANRRQLIPAAPLLTLPSA